MSEAATLQARYHHVAREWLFRADAPPCPAGPATLQVGDVAISVSLLEPDHLLGFVVSTDVLSGMVSEETVDLVQRLIGTEAAALLHTDRAPADHSPAEVLWAPALATQWHRVARLALLAQLEDLHGMGSPWWPAEMATQAEGLELPVERLHPQGLAALGRALLRSPLQDDVELATRARQVGGPAALGPVEVYESLARQLTALDEPVAHQLAHRAAELAPALPAAGVEEWAALPWAPSLLALPTLGGRPARIQFGAQDLVVGEASFVLDAHAGVATVTCVVSATRAAQALRCLWARAHTADDEGRVKLIALARFDDSALDHVPRQHAPDASFFTGADHVLVAELLLPPEVAVEELVVDVTTRPGLRPPDADESYRLLARNLTIDAAQAARLGHPSAAQLFDDAVDAHLEAEDSAEAEQLRRHVAGPAPAAALGELAELDLDDEQRSTD